MAKKPEVQEQTKILASILEDNEKYAKEENGEFLTDLIVSTIAKCASKNKMKPTDVTWDDFREYAKYYFGKGDLEIARRHITRVGGFAVIRDSHFKPEGTGFLQDKIEMKARAQFNRSVSVEAARNLLVMNQIEKMAKELFSGKIIPSGFSKKSVPDKTKRTLNLLLSDLHIRSMIDAKEVGIGFGPQEEARRLAAVALEAANYKERYRDVTSLNIFLLGDIIQGQLHDKRDGAPLAEQVCAAQFLLGHLVAYLAPKFPKVNIYCTPGNHGRNVARHGDRAVHQKWDAIETCIYHSIKMMAKDLKNVTVEIPKSPYIVFDNFGQKGFATHGDSVFIPGFPGRNINVGFIENQVNKLNASLPDKEEFRVVFFGHVHTGALVWLSNGAAMITNGALVPPDPYAISIGQFETACGQTMFESVPGFMVGDYRYIRLGKEQDQDRELEKIIPPFLDP